MKRFPTSNNYKNAQKFKLIEFDEWFTDKDEVFKEMSNPPKIAPPTLPYIQNKIKENKSNQDIQNESPENIHVREKNKKRITKKKKISNTKIL